MSETVIYRRAKDCQLEALTGKERVHCQSNPIEGRERTALARHDFLHGVVLVRRRVESGEQKAAEGDEAEFFWVNLMPTATCTNLDAPVYWSLSPSLSLLF